MIITHLNVLLVTYIGYISLARQWGESKVDGEQLSVLTYTKHILIVINTRETPVLCSRYQSLVD